MIKWILDKLDNAMEYILAVGLVEHTSRSKIILTISFTVWTTRVSTAWRYAAGATPCSDKNIHQ